MTVLDAYAVLALLKGEPAAPDVQRIIEVGDASLTALGVAEVLDHLVRIASATEEDAVLDLAQLGLDEPVAVGERLSQTAGLLRARHDHRTRRAVSLADCVAAVVAGDTEHPLATSDSHLLDLCHDEGIPATVLPDSAGNRWTPPST